MNFAELQAIVAVFQKDLRLQGRQRRSFFMSILFALLIVVMGSFGFYTGSAQDALIVPGLLWIVLAFSGLLIMTESWVNERESDAFRLLHQSAPNLVSVFFGKMLSAYLLMLLTSMWTCFLLQVFFHSALFNHCAELACIVLFGLLGFSAAGTLFSSLAMHGNYRESFLGILLFPLISPGLIGAVVATRELLLNSAASTTTSWLGLLCAFDLVAIALSAILFERLADR